MSSRFRYDPQAPDVRDLMRQIREAAAAEREDEAAFAALGGASPPSPAPKADPLWQHHEQLMRSFSMGLESGGPEPFFKHLYLMNRGYLSYDGGEPQTPVDFPFPASSRRLVGRVIDRLRRWLFHLLADYFAHFEAQMRTSLLKQVQFNAETVRLANDLKLKIETQRRFNETTTQFVQDLIYRLHEHSCEMLAHARALREHSERLDSLFTLGTLAQASEERLELVRRELEELAAQVAAGESNLRPPHGAS